MERILLDTTFRINTPRVVHQTIEGETIMIDFDNGAYFSADGAGAVIWEQVALGASVNDIVDAVTRCYAGEHAEIKAGVEVFLIELQRESLIALSDGAMSVRGLSPAITNPTQRERPAFEMPSLQKYTDMQDLLLLDPIHEVDEQGWPIKKDVASE